MADNVTTNPGAGGAVIATDEVDGIHFQLIKMTYGTDGEVSNVTASTGLPVSIVDGGAAGDASAAKQDTGNASLAAIDAKLGAAVYYPAMQQVSGTVTANAGSGTFAVSAVSLPLPDGAASDEMLAGVIELLREVSIRLSDVADSVGNLMPDAAGRLRVNAEVLGALSTITTVTTVGTVSNQASIGGYAANQQMLAMTQFNEAQLRRNVVIN